MSSVLPIAFLGLSSASRRLETAATSIATDTGDLEQAAVELMMSKISFEAEARVAEVLAKAADRLLDIMA